MSRMWLRYEKGEEAKYISHLDFLRAMTRTLKRAEIPVSYSQGFNPHQKLSFALPLPLGTTSICELMELETDMEIAPEELVERLNKNVPFGIKFLESGISPDKNKFKAIAYSKYVVKPYCDIKEDELLSFLAKDEIITLKKTKSGEKETDIKKDINSIKIEGDNLIMILAAGNDANLKPEVVIRAMNENIDGFECEMFDCKRTGIMDKNLNYV